MTNKKFTYGKMTLILSIIGFIGSIGFYLGVLKQVYATPDNIQVKVSELERENNQLKTQITVLTKMVDECQDK